MKPMKRVKFEKAIKQQGGIVDANRGKGSHTQVRLNGRAFTYPMEKEVPGYVVKQAKQAGLRL